MRAPRLERLLGAIACLSLVLVAGASPASNERFTAIVDQENAPPLRVTVGVNDWTSDADAQKLLAAFKSGGNTALRDAMLKMNSGYVSVTGSLGWPMNVARTYKNGAGTRVLVAAARPLGFGAVVSGSAITNYPFGVIVLNSDASGKWSGVLVQAAALKIGADGKIELGSWGESPVDLFDVKKQK